MTTLDEARKKASSRHEEIKKILSEEALTQKELAGRLLVSERSIYRFLERLPLTKIPGRPARYYYDKELNEKENEEMNNNNVMTAGDGKYLIGGLQRKVIDFSNIGIRTKAISSGTFIFNVADLYIQGDKIKVRLEVNKETLPQIITFDMPEDLDILNKFLWACEIDTFGKVELTPELLRGRQVKASTTWVKDSSGKNHAVLDKNSFAYASQKICHLLLTDEESEKFNTAIKEVGEHCKHLNTENIEALLKLSGENCSELYIKLYHDQNIPLAEIKQKASYVATLLTALKEVIGEKTNLYHELAEKILS